MPYVMESSPEEIDSVKSVPEDQKSVALIRKRPQNTLLSAPCSALNASSTCFIDLYHTNPPGHGAVAANPRSFLRLLKVRRNLILFICHAFRGAPPFKDKIRP